jgi:prolyl oligopeptidase
MAEMRCLILLLLFAAVILAASNAPASRRDAVVDDLHGVKVEDPYRWLEEIDSPQTKAWVEAQNRYARQHLDRFPGRESLGKRLAELYHFTRSQPYALGNNTYAGILKRGGSLFYLRQDGSQNQPALYVKPASGAERILIDPNTLSKDGTAALSSWAPSPDGRWLAYGVAKAGSDWQEWFVREVATGKDLPDKLEWIKFASPVWTPDGAGFYYGRFPEPEKGALLTGANYNNKLYYHRLRAAQSSDMLIYERPEQREWSFTPWPAADGSYLLILVSHGTRRERMVFVKDLRTQDAKVREVVREFAGRFAPLENNGSVVTFHTTYKAPRGRIIAMDVSRGGLDQAREIVPEAAQALQQVVFTRGHFVAEYLQDAKSAVRIYRPDGKLFREVTLPGAGNAAWSLGLPGETEQFYSFTGFVSPMTIYRYDWDTGKSSPLFSGRLPFDPEAFETRQVFYTSKDGTKIPMFVTAKKGLAPDGRGAALLYGYGGFNVSLLPSFNPLYIAWMEMGGALAIANLRGGGEYGEAWHAAGMKHNKQNVFDDFIAAAEWLIANKYAAKEKVGILGASNGGLLVGACLNQRPDLFGAAIPQVGVMDMLRFHKFTIGRAWVSDYGSPDIPADFAVLRKYSPLHNIRKGVAYPPTLVMTADHDDRVVPSHSFKYAAALQHAHEGQAPILIRIETSAGHGAGKPTSKRIEEGVDMLAFLRHALKI